MTLKKQTYCVLESDKGRVDILVARLLGFSRARVRGLMDHEGVTLNGTECLDYGAQVKAQDVLGLIYDPERKYREKPAERKTHGFSLVFCDEHLAVVNKEAGILTVPTDRREKNSLVDLLSTHLASGQSRGPKVSLVHRLDRDTSGLLVFGQRPAIAEDLIRQFSARKPEREYYAIVAGKLAQDQGTIRSFLQTDKALNQKSSTRGELAITHYRVITRYPDSSLVAVNLETGRRNQIRVHFAEMGHPILGDERYEKDRAFHPDWPYKRLALHARMLGFNHPVTRRELRFEAEVPEEFKRFSRRFGN
ncbi:MAG TPA: RluA family pseudouridine synthase [Oligoflexus sp.]|uniref:RluA family pseudouridine synthase n=1 Tax=Oligoflexus sp. TaxID=1971216 RepID=UPI002D8082E4|nr:RluA family pseudouridine synthase [Oligoflexus sp.]HET9237506.1 RluA family pseudouridine synthase [Oligoflexus sp.]